MTKIPSRFPGSANDELCFAVTDETDEALAVCPACVGKHRPHTYKEGCSKAGKEPAKAPPSGVKQEASADKEPAEPASKKRVVADPDTYVETPGSSSKDTSLPGHLEPLPGGEGQEKPAGTQVKPAEDKPVAPVSRDATK